MDAHKKEKLEIVSQLADLRGELRESRAALRNSLNFKNKLIDFYDAHSKPALGVSALSGFILARIIKPNPHKKTKKKEKSHGGLKAFILTSLIAAAKPLAQNWISKQAKIQINKRLNRVPLKSNLGEQPEL